MLVRPSFYLLIAGSLALTLSSCKPEGYINTVKYDGKKVVNTCESFSEEVSRVIDANRSANLLQVARGDNSDRAYFYLDRGQFEVKNDTLFFRLNQDFEYRNYLDKGVAVWVNVAYQTPEGIRDIELPAEGAVGRIVVDRPYYVANNKPEFSYKIPLGGQPVAGKQILLSFGIAKYTKAGDLKKVFCETEAAPIGTATPGCCTDVPWNTAQLQSVIDLPKLEVKDESYRYRGFTGTLDILFNESSFAVPDTVMGPLMIQAFVDKFKKFGYDIQTINLTGYASPGGKEPYNEKLAQKRAETILKRVEFLQQQFPNLKITAEGKGEDWARVKEYTQSTAKLTAEQKNEVLSIIAEPITNDEKEAKLRKVPYWTILVDEVLIKARHTFSVHDYAYAQPGMTIDAYPNRLPINSRELEQVAAKVIAVTGYKPGVNAKEQINSINDLLTRKATSNLYAMRASYHLASDNLDYAVNDLEAAQKISDRGDDYYSRIAKGIRLTYLDTYDLPKRKSLFQDYTTLTQQNPGDRTLFFNRAVILEKTGALSSVLKEYDALLEGETPTAAQLNNRGVARLKASMVTMALADFQAATQKDPNLAEAHYNLAVAAAWKGLSRQSVDALKKAVELNPKYKAMALNNPAFAVLAQTPLFDSFR